MTGVTLVVCCDARGNSQRRRAPAGAAVTGGTSTLRPRNSPHVLGMIELDVEALVESRRKSFQRWVRAIYVLVTDDAHRNIRSNKLRQMTAGAGFMSREPWRRGIVAPLVTRVAGQRCVTLARMLEV